MNEKFFDLKKEKQDRIINAALKVFAMNGYDHSSTDEIVKEAGISKGLLFHYFISKMGLYSFLYDYSVRFLTLEFKSSVPASEKDYFAIMTAEEISKRNVLRSYPFMQLFIERSQNESNEEAVNETADLRNELQDLYDSFLGQVDASTFRSDVDPAAVNLMLNASLSHVMTENLQSVNFNADKNYNECKSYIDMMKVMSC